MERMLRRIAIRKDWTIPMSEFRKFAEKYQWEIDKLEEENRKLKLHIEAKDKAYTALLKDYEEIKEKNKELEAEIWEWLNSIRNMIR
jgi:phage terminase Nu1 subunit (DNA packaging protein)